MHVIKSVITENWYVCDRRKNIRLLNQTFYLNMGSLDAFGIRTCKYSVQATNYLSDR